MIGFYDSGIGGLTIVEKFQKLRPNQKMVYLADVANCPLGNKTTKQIQEITLRGVEFLFDKGCDLVLLACNTATSVAIRHIQQDWLIAQPRYTGKNVLGVIKPVTEDLVATGSLAEPILVLATEATCKSKFYQSELKSQSFVEYDCLSFYDLAAAIESQNYSVIESSLWEGFCRVNDISKYQSIVLACTHYPLVIPRIDESLKRMGLTHRYKIVDQSKLAAEKLADYFNRHPQYLSAPGNLKIFVSTQDTDAYEKKVRNLFPSLNFEIQS